MQAAAVMFEAVRNFIPLAAATDAQTAPFAHDRTFVAVSMVLAVVGSFTALELGARSRAHEGAAANFWLAASGFTMATGVWAMHFVGLIALETPLMRGFTVPATVASYFVAVTMGAAGYVIGGARWDWVRYPLSGVLAGLGAVLMHYLGMKGLIIDADLSYRAPIVLSTSLGAIISSVAALWLCTTPRPLWMNVAAAFFMGAVIASLHFFDMAGAVLAPHPRFSPANPDERVLALAVTFGVAVLAVLAYFALRYDEARASLEMTRAPRRRISFGKLGSGPVWRAPDDDGVVVIPDRSDKDKRRR